jgi:formylglycine-generating enzyme required for sulfatase activity
LQAAEERDRSSIVRHAERWREAIDSVASPTRSPRYRGLRLVPTPGLVPIGQDPRSLLWEFAVVRTAANPAAPFPTRDADGRISVHADDPVVMVLIPGGDFEMGEDRREARVASDEPAPIEEGPKHLVSLDPFFISKFEVTFAQWTRLIGTHPFEKYGIDFGYREPGPTTPVGGMTWRGAHAWLDEADLELPTEAQWEYACRAGTRTRWWTGDEKASIASAGNVSDQTAFRKGAPQGWGGFEDFDDGRAKTAPVGSYAPNGFGLHDTIGNVWEYCADYFDSYAAPTAEGDGRRIGPARNMRVCRGGSHESRAFMSRSASRYGIAVDFVGDHIGLRPMRRLDS